MYARFTESTDRPDYSDLMRRVALALLGSTTTHHGAPEWRYGTHGSLSIDLHKNVYYDHQAGHGGSVLGLIDQGKGDLECLDANDTPVTPDARRNRQAPRCGAAYD